MNFLDADGKTIATEEQVEGFNWVGQELALPVSLDLSDKPGVEVASIEPSASLSDFGMTKPNKDKLPVLEATEVIPDGNGRAKATFAFTNETKEDLKNLRTGVACYDTAGKIIGGTQEYPELAPAGKTINIDAESIVSEAPATCKLFVNYDVS